MGSSAGKPPNVCQIVSPEYFNWKGQWTSEIVATTKFEYFVNEAELFSYEITFYITLITHNMVYLFITLRAPTLENSILSGYNLSYPGSLDVTLEQAYFLGNFMEVNLLYAAGLCTWAE